MGEFVRLGLCILMGLALTIPTVYFVAPLYPDPSARQIMMILMGILLSEISMILWFFWEEWRERG